jgi:hypothetical protein
MEKRKSTKPRVAAKAPAEPWDKKNPKTQGEHKPLSPQAKAAAKRRAKAAGRPYPNLVDNMRASVAARKK